MNIFKKWLVSQIAKCPEAFTANYEQHANHRVWLENEIAKAQRLSDDTALVIVEKDAKGLSTNGSLALHKTAELTLKYWRKKLHQHDQSVFAFGYMAA